MRIVSGMMFAAALVFAAGCGKPDAPGEAKAPDGTTSVPLGEMPKVESPAVVPAWEMDPAKHAIPTGPASGKFRGEAATYDVQAEKDCLRFRAVSKEGIPTGNTVEIRPTDAAKLIEGLSLTVKADQPDGLDVPSVVVTDPSNPSEDSKILTKGYALTLNVGKRDKGRVSGRVYLSLNDDKKSFLAGNFSAEWIRDREELPGAEDAPFIHGKLTVNGIAEPHVNIGYIRVDPAQPIISNGLGTVIGSTGYPARSDNFRPRWINLFPVKSKEPARYEFTRLDPGRYWVYASAKNGPAVWKWISVEANSQIVADFTIESGTVGGLEVTAPTGTESVSILPASEPGKPWPESTTLTVSSSLELLIDTASSSKSDPTKPVTVKFPRLAPGKYEVWSGDAKVEVEVKANETAKVELKKK